MGYMDEALRARLVELAEEVEHSTFRETKWGRRGYAEKDVDDFLDYVVDVIAGLLSMDSAPHVMSVHAEVVEEEYHSDVVPGPGAVVASEGEGAEIPTVLVTSTPDIAAPEGAEAEEPVSEVSSEQVGAPAEESDVTWTPPESPFRGPPVETVAVIEDAGTSTAGVSEEDVTSESEVGLLLEEPSEVDRDATVAWQPESPPEPRHEDEVPEAEVPQAEAPEGPVVQPRPGGKPVRRPGGPQQPPPPPWAAHTG